MIEATMRVFAVFAMGMVGAVACAGGEPATAEPAVPTPLETAKTSPPDAGQPLVVPAPVESPFQCVETSQVAELVVDVEFVGCFGGSEQSLRLAANGDVVTLRGESDVMGGRGRYAVMVSKEHSISASERLFAVRTEGVAAMRAETGMRCETTTKLYVRLSWCCSNPHEKPTSGVVTFSGSACLDFLPENVSASPRPGYDRANGVRGATEALLDRYGISEDAQRRVREIIEAIEAKRRHERAP